MCSTAVCIVYKPKLFWSPLGSGIQDIIILAHNNSVWLPGCPVWWCSVLPACCSSGFGPGWACHLPASPAGCGGAAGQPPALQRTDAHPEEALCTRWDGPINILILTHVAKALQSPHRFERMKPDFFQKPSLGVTLFCTGKEIQHNSL